MNKKKRMICCIPTCKGERFDLAHKFPRCSLRAHMWLEAIGCPQLDRIPLFKLSQMYQVCSRHFRSKDYKHEQSRSLNMTAVPSLNLKDLSQLHLSKDSTVRTVKSQPTIIIDELINKAHCDDKVESLINDLEETSITEIVSTPIQNEVIPIKELEEKPTDYFAAIEELGTPIKDFEQKQTSDYLTVVVIDEEQSNPSPDAEVSFKSNTFSTFFDLKHPSYENKLSLNSFWLRCHCCCMLCYDRTTRRRKISPIDIADDIQPNSVDQVDGLDVLSIEWNDSHKSEYDVNFLFSLQINEETHSICPIPWHKTSDDIQDYTPIKFNRLISCDENIEMVFQSIIRHGFTVVTNIPTQSNAMAKAVICHLFPQLENTHFEELTETHLDVCTNITYSSAESALKCFFITQDVEIILVDGLNVAQKLKSSNGGAFEILSRVPVPLEVGDSNVRWKIKAPIIELHPETEQVLQLRLDVHRIGVLNTLPLLEVEKFYESLKQIIKATQANENQQVLTFKAGTMLILDNWRIFHKCGRNSGIRQSFIERKDFVSRMRYFGLM